MHRLAAQGDGRARRDLRAAGLQRSAGTSAGSPAPASSTTSTCTSCPRWAGDTNFMPVLADVKVLPEHLAETRAKLASAWPT